MNPNLRAKAAIEVYTALLNAQPKTEPEWLAKLTESHLQALMGIIKRGGV